MSQAVSTTGTRETFVTNILTVYNQYNIDGIDIDWEYPGQVGASGNTATPSDSANFLAFLQLLKVALPPHARITAAVQSEVFAGSDGNPMDDVSAFKEVLDWVLIMNYDVWGCRFKFSVLFFLFFFSLKTPSSRTLIDISFFLLIYDAASSSPGPNAPLYDRCQNSTQPDMSAYAGFHAWTSAGFPASQIVLGLPSYGYVSKSTTNRLRQRGRRSDEHLAATRPQFEGGAGVESNAGSAVEVAGDDADDDAGDDSGQVQFKELITQGAIIRNPVLDVGDGDGGDIATYSASGGFTRYWDDCSSTPFLRSSGGQVITYDDPGSLAMKAMFAAKVGMLGVNMFDIHGDSVEWDLIRAARRGLLGV